MILAFYEKDTRILRGVLNVPALVSSEQAFGAEYESCVLDVMPNIDPSFTYIVTVNCTVEKAPY